MLNTIVRWREMAMGGQILAIFAVAALTTAPFVHSALAQEQDRDEKERKFHFEFEFDGDSLLFGDLADLRIDPPDLSALENLQFHFAGPEGSFELEGMHTRAKERMEVAQLERESREIARQLRRADGAERRELESQLRTKLDEIFEIKMRLRRERIERMEERLQEERAKLQERAEGRDEIIERRYDELLGSEDPFEW